MIWRIWSVLMVVLVGGVWLLAIPYSPQPILETGTVINLYRAMGIVPEAGAISFSKELEHDVFEVPERDKTELKKTMASMNMDGMAMEEGAEHGEDAMAMRDMAIEEGVEPNQESMTMSGMAMEDGAEHGEEAMNMSGMAMEEAAEHGEEAANMGGMSVEEEGGHGSGSAAEGLMILAQGKAVDVEREIMHDGIKIDLDATIDLKEWDVGSGMTMARVGETIRLTIRNSGNIPHEFMIMKGAAMQAVNYRLNRPDWNLLEHEATTEVPFLMPGDTIDMVVRITKPGIWMYMCMFPYHMQLGMMGMLMTPDMMGKMDMNMEMDMFMPRS